MTQSKLVFEPLAVAVVMAEDPADPRPARRARLANVLLPCAGLVAQDRIVRGVLLGLAFWLPLAVAFYGTWIAPADVRPAASLALAGSAVTIYLLGQVVLSRVLADRARRIADYATSAVPMMRAAYGAMSAGNWIEAQLRLDELLAFDPESFEGNLAQARLLAIQGKADQAERAYRKFRRLDGGSRWEWEVGRELALLK